MKRHIETIEHEGECSRLHVIDEAPLWQDRTVLVWLDTDIGTEDGIVIGMGRTRAQAIDDAIEELEARLTDLKEAQMADETEGTNDDTTRNEPTDTPSSQADGHAEPLKDPEPEGRDTSER